MDLKCRHAAHLPHVWPPLPLKQNHMILSCEQYCQWCLEPAKNQKRWDSTTNLRKHARCHIEKDSKFSIQTAGKGGRQPIRLRDKLMNTQLVPAQRLEETGLGSELDDQSQTGSRRNSNPSPSNIPSPSPIVESSSTTDTRNDGASEISLDEQSPTSQQLVNEATPPLDNIDLSRPRLSSPGPQTVDDPLSETGNTSISSVQRESSISERSVSRERNPNLDDSWRRQYVPRPSVYDD